MRRVELLADLSGDMWGLLCDDLRAGMHAVFAFQLGPLFHYVVRLSGNEQPKKELLPHMRANSENLVLSINFRVVIRFPRKRYWMASTLRKKRISATKKSKKFSALARLVGKILVEPVEVVCINKQPFAARMQKIMKK